MGKRRRNDATLVSPHHFVCDIQTNYERPSFTRGERAVCDRTQPEYSDLLVRSEFDESANIGAESLTHIWKWELYRSLRERNMRV